MYSTNFHLNKWFITFNQKSMYFGRDIISPSLYSSGLWVSPSSTWNASSYFLPVADASPSWGKAKKDHEVQIQLVRQPVGLALTFQTSVSLYYLLCVGMELTFSVAAHSVVS